MMKKIKIELTPEELASLIHIVGGREKDTQNLLPNKNISLGITEKLIAALTDSQKEATIKVQVKAAIARLIGITDIEIKDNDNLTKDLNMTSHQIRSLAIPFSHTAGQYKPGATVSPDDCESQETVQDCVDLIISKI